MENLYLRNYCKMGAVKDQFSKEYYVVYKSKGPMFVCVFINEKPMDDEYWVRPLVRELNEEERRDIQLDHFDEVMEAKLKLSEVYDRAMILTD